MDTERLSGTALYGCGFAVRALITLTLNAIQFFGRQQLDAVFVRDEADARSWTDAQRAALDKKVQHGG